MAITIPANGIGAYVNGTGDLTPVIPTGAQAGDMLLLFFAVKPYNETILTPTGWTLLSSSEGGTVASGNDVGSMQTRCYYKVHSGSETNPTVVTNISNVAAAVIVSARKEAGATWGVAGNGGADTTSGTAFSALVTSIAQTLNFGVGGGANSIAISSSGSKIYYASSVNQDLAYHVAQRSLGMPFQPSTAGAATTYFDSSRSFQTGGTSITFSADGTKMHICSNANIFQYALSTPFDVTTASPTTSITVAANSRHALSPDGTRLYVVDVADDLVRHYQLSTAWDVTTGTFTSSLSVGAQEATPTGMAISSDGTKLYIVGNTADTLFQYTLPTPWSLSGASYASKSFSLVPLAASNVGSICPTPDGTRFFVAFAGSLYEFHLTTAWDISTATYRSALPGDMFFGYAATPTDAATQSAISISATGVTFGSFTEAPTADLVTTAGGDMSMSGGYTTVSTGAAASTAFNYASTLSTASTGSAMLVRLRELVDPNVTLAPARFDNTNTFYSATTSAGPVTLTPARFDNTQAFYAPTVFVPPQTLTPALFQDVELFYAPTVARGPVTLTAARFDNTTTFYAPSISQPQVLGQRTPFANIPGDEYFDSVIALLLCNTAGVDNSFGFSNWSIGGSATISTAQFVTGGASLYLNNSSLFRSSSTDFNQNDGDFTIDCWYYEESGSGGAIVARRSANASGFALQTSGLRAVVNGVWSDTQITWTRPSLNDWHHLAYVRSGTNLYIFVDGVVVGTKASVTTMGDEAISAYIGLGSNTGENAFKGYIDNFRWTKGVARWTSNFVPPTTERALLPGAQSTAYDLNFDNVRLLLNGEGANGAQVFRDRSNRPTQVTVQGTQTRVAHEQYRFGNSSIYFDGFGDMLRLDGGALPFGTSDFTVDFWYYTSATNRISTFLRGDDNGTNGKGVEIYHDSTSLRFGINNGGTFTEIVSTPVSGIPLDEWNYFSFVRSGSSWYIFINGVQAGTTGSSSATVAAATFYRVGGNSAASDYSALGYIDDFRVTIGTARNTGTYAVPIQETSAASRFPPSKVGSRQDLTQATRFNNPSIYDTLFDSVSLLLLGNGTNGSTTITDSSLSPKTLTRVGNTQISTAQSKFGGASIAFDGSGDYIDIPGQSLGTGDFTVEKWVYFTSFASAPTILDSRVVAPTADFVLYNSSGSVITLFLAGANRASTASLSTGVWYHFAVSRASGVTRFFVNGTQVGTNYTDTNNYNHTTLRAGANLNGTNSHNGFIDDLRITKGAARYTANFTAPTFQHPLGQFGGASAAQGAGALVLAQATRFDNTNTFYAATVSAVRTLTPALFSNANTFYAATLTSVRTLTPALFTNTQTFYSPTVLQAQLLTAARFDNTNTFYAATVARGPVTLTPALFQDVEVFYAPTVARGPVTLTPARFDNTNVFYAPTVAAGAQTLTPARFDNTNTFYAATVSATRTLTASLYTNTNTFYAHAASALNLLTAARFDNTNVFYNATVSALRTLTPALFTNAQTFYAATVARGPVTLTPALFTNANAFYSATLTASYALTAARFDNAHAFYSATVAASNTLAPALFTNANTFYAATLAGGASLLLPALYTNANTFYAATVARGAITLTPARFNNTNTFYGATVTSFRTLTVDRFDNVTTFFVATLVRGPVGLQPARYNNVNAFYAPAVNQLTGIFPNRYDDADTFYAASIQVLTPTLFPQRFNNTNVFPFHYLAGGVQFVTQGEFDVFDFGSEVAVLGRTPTLASKSLTPSSTILTTSNPVFTRLTKTDQTVKGGPRPAIFVK